MGLCFYKFLLLCFLSIFISPAIAKRSFHPKALMLPLQKDTATLQYVTQIMQRTPLVPVKLTVHLGGVGLWVDCGKGYASSTNITARCGSAQCNLAAGRAKICGPSGGNGICGLSTYNPISNTGIIDSLRIDVVSIESTTNGRAVTVPKFIFLCGSDPFVLRGLATGVTGITALGRSEAALPSQLAATFSFHRKFAICLSPSSSNGIIIIGDVPNNNVDVSKSLTYTPLIINPAEIESGFLGIPSNEYFIGGKSIKVSRKAIIFSAKLLSIDKNGYEGTKISTAVPHTVLET